VILREGCRPIEGVRPHEAALATFPIVTCGKLHGAMLRRQVRDVGATLSRSDGRARRFAEPGIGAPWPARQIRSSTSPWPASSRRRSDPMARCSLLGARCERSRTSRSCAGTSSSSRSRETDRGRPPTHLRSLLAGPNPRSAASTSSPTRSAPSSIQGGACASPFRSMRARFERSFPEDLDRMMERIERAQAASKAAEGQRAREPLHLARWPPLEQPGSPPPPTAAPRAVAINPLRQQGALATHDPLRPRAPVEPRPTSVRFASPTEPRTFATLPAAPTTTVGAAGGGAQGRGCDSPSGVPSRTASNGGFPLDRIRALEGAREALRRMGRTREAARAHETASEIVTALHAQLTGSEPAERMVGGSARASAPRSGRQLIPDLPKSHPCRSHERRNDRRGTGLVA
jgi:hypothetical protein